MEGKHGDIRRIFSFQKNLTRGLHLTKLPHPCGRSPTLLHEFYNPPGWPGVHPWGKPNWHVQLCFNRDLTNYYSVLWSSPDRIRASLNRLDYPQQYKPLVYLCKPQLQVCEQADGASHEGLCELTARVVATKTDPDRRDLWIGLVSVLWHRRRALLRPSMRLKALAAVAMSAWRKAKNWRRLACMKRGYSATLDRNLTFSCGEGWRLPYFAPRRII